VQEKGAEVPVLVPYSSHQSAALCTETAQTHSRLGDPINAKKPRENSGFLG
jgi:hypothetical protein